MLTGGGQEKRATRKGFYASIAMCKCTIHGLTREKRYEEWKHYATLALTCFASLLLKPQAFAARYLQPMLRTRCGFSARHFVITKSWKFNVFLHDYL